MVREQTSTTPRASAYCAYLSTCGIGGSCRRDHFPPTRSLNACQPGGRSATSRAVGSRRTICSKQRYKLRLKERATSGRLLISLVACLGRFRHVKQIPSV